MLGKRNGNSWALEKAMRTEMLRRFFAVKANDKAIYGDAPYRLRESILRNMNITLAIQNDADEVPSKSVEIVVCFCEILISKHKYLYRLCCT